MGMLYGFDWLGALVEWRVSWGSSGGDPWTWMPLRLSGDAVASLGEFGKNLRVPLLETPTPAYES